MLLSGLHRLVIHCDFLVSLMLVFNRNGRALVKHWLTHVSPALDQVGTGYERLRVCNNWIASMVSWWDLCLTNLLWFLRNDFFVVFHIWALVMTSTELTHVWAVGESFSPFPVFSSRNGHFERFRVLTLTWIRYWPNRYTFRFVSKSSVILMSAHLVNEQNCLNLLLILFSQLTYWISIIILTDLTAHFYPI